MVSEIAPVCLWVTKQCFALDPVNDESIDTNRNLELDVGSLVIALTPERLDGQGKVSLLTPDCLPEVMLVAEGNLEPGQDILQPLFMLLPDTLLDGLGQMTIAVILQCGQEHLSSSLSS